MGKWKNRRDDPFQNSYTDSAQKIHWTSKNVEYLGLYVGNVNPGLKTFLEILPKVKKRLNFWKPLALPVLSKARVLEIFHASKLWYAFSFYPIPTHLQEDIDDAFLDYIIFPKNKIEVSRMEMEKERAQGGLKLINTKIKSETSKVHWLIRMITEDDLTLHYKIFCLLLGEQYGGLKGKDLLFTEKTYVDKHVKCNSSFYREALSGISKLDTWKHIPDINEEHLFYNTTFSTTQDAEELHETTVKPFKGNKTLCRITTYGELIAAENTISQPKLKAAIRRKIESIVFIRPSCQENEILGFDNSRMQFKDATQKFLYTQLILQKSLDHAYQTKWALDNDDLDLITWDAVWETIHQQFFTEEVKSTIWEQIHLNFYTTYNYNKWHNTLQPCPLCRKIPDNIYHIIRDCAFTDLMWRKIQPTLLKIIPIYPDIQEKSFGLLPRNKDERDAIILRNWVTFTLRHYIMKEEKRAYHCSSYSTPQITAFAQRVNHQMKNELYIKSLQYIFRHLQDKFDSISTTNGAVCRRTGEGYFWPDIL